MIYRKSYHRVSSNKMRSKIALRYQARSFGAMEKSALISEGVLYAIYVIGYLDCHYLGSLLAYK